MSFLKRAFEQHLLRVQSKKSRISLERKREEARKIVGVQQGKPCDDYDKTLNTLLDWVDAGGLDIKDIGKYTVSIGGIRIWTENWPFGYGKPWQDELLSDDLFPHPETVVRLKSVIENYTHTGSKHIHKDIIERAFKEMMESVGDK